MNFVHGNPLTCVSIGLAINRKIVLGVISVPLIGHTYTAIKGRGAFLNGDQVSISPIFYEHLFCMKVFCAAFMCLKFGFVMFWQKDLGTKVAHKMLVKLTSGASFEKFTLATYSCINKTLSSSI
jgi:hypothetical protein